MNDYYEELRRESRECVRSLRLIDDDFMKVVFEDRASVEVLLRVVLNKKLTVKSVKTEYIISNLYGRSIRIDIFAVDDDGVMYSIEVQRADIGAQPRRTRYISSILDANITEPGDRFENLNETYVIFITENDVLGGDCSLYHVDRNIREMEKSFGDGTHIIYVNGAKIDDTELGRLMHDFRCTESKDMYNPVLAERVRYFKETEEGESHMCEAVEKLMIKKKNEGKVEEREKMVRHMRLMGYSEEQINKLLAEMSKEVA